MTAWTMRGPLEARTHRVSIAGRVVERSAETPIAGAQVVVTGPVTREARSNAEGLFWYEDLPDGEYAIATGGHERDGEVGRTPVQAHAGEAGAPPVWIQVHVVGVAVPRPNGG